MRGVKRLQSMRGRRRLVENYPHCRFHAQQEPRPPWAAVVRLASANQTSAGFDMARCTAQQAKQATFRIKNLDGGGGFAGTPGASHASAPRRAARPSQAA